MFGGCEVLCGNFGVICFGGGQFWIKTLLILSKLNKLLEVDFLSYISVNFYNIFLIAKRVK
jgi:hypothetical protein